MEALLDNERGLGDKSTKKYMWMMNSQGKKSALLYNVLSEIFGSIGNNQSILIPNSKTLDKWWYC